MINTVFTARAEALLQGATGLHAIDYHGIFPAAGDLVTVRTAPGNAVVHTRCRERRFAFESAGELSLTIELDTAVLPSAMPDDFLLGIEHMAQELARQVPYSKLAADEP